MGDGTITSPVSSVSAALDIVRDKKAQGIDGKWVIKVAGGDYRITDTISILSSDSGTKDAPLVIEAQDKNNPPRFTGGIDIPFSELTDASESIRERINDTNNNVKALDLKSYGIEDYGTISRRGHLTTAGQTAQMIVSVDGTDMKLAQWPNDSWLTITDEDVLKSGDRKLANMQEGAIFKFYDERMENWAKPDDAWVTGSLGYNFDYDYYPVGGIDTSSGTVTLSEGAIVTKKEYPNKYTNHFFKFENILEEIDVPGEYYIDRDEGMLYIYPPEDADENSVITFSALDKNMVEINEAHDITIRNIEFHSGRKTAVTTVDGGERIRLEDCMIHGFGKDGVSLSLNENSTVKGCTIYDIGENAVNIRGGDYVNVVSSANVVEENEIYRFAQLERAYKTGIMVGDKSVGTVVRHNYIHDAPHAAIIMYGVNNLFENNYIERAVTDFYDMDAIYINNYTSPWERGNVFRNNYFNDIGNRVLGQKQINVTAIRTDNSGHGLEIYHNVFHNIGKGQNNGVTAIRAQGTYNKVWENLFVDCSGTYNSNMTYVAGKEYDTNSDYYQIVKPQLDTRLPVYSTLFPELSRFWQEHPQAVMTNEFKDNAVVNIDYEYSTINYTPATLESMEEGYCGAPELVDASGNLVTTQDPGFADYENGDYTILPGSTAYETVNGNTDFNIECKGKK